MKSRCSPNREREATLFGSLFGLGDPCAGALGGGRIGVVFDHYVVEPEGLVFQAHVFEADTESVERSGVEAEPGIFVEVPGGSVRRRIASGCGRDRSQRCAAYCARDEFAASPRSLRLLGFLRRRDVLGSVFQGRRWPQTSSFDLGPRTRSGCSGIWPRGAGCRQPWECCGWRSAKSW